MSDTRQLSGKEESELLMNELLPLATRMLREHGEFYPYGGYVTEDGEIVHVGAKGSSERPKAEQLVKLLLEDFRGRAARGECRATGVVFDVRVTPPDTLTKTDAIQVNLEHKDCYSAEVFFPYTIPCPGVVDFGTTFAQQGEHTVFSSHR